MKKLKEFILINKINLGICFCFLILYMQNDYKSFSTLFVKQLLIITFITIGVSIEMLCGDFDLAFAAQIAATTVIGAFLIKEGIQSGIAFLIMLIIHAIIGAMKGYLLVKLRMPSIIMTWGLQIILTMSLAGITEGKSIMIPLDKNYYSSILFWRIMSITFVVMVLGVYLLLNHTYYGKYCRMLGENMNLAEDSGLDCVGISVYIHIAASLFFAVPSIIILVQTYSGSPFLGVNYLYKALSAACLGGIGILNGKGKVSGMVMGSISIILIIFIMTSTGVINRVETIIEGFIIIFALYTQQKRK